MARMTTAEYNKRNQKLDSYLLNNPDVLAAAKQFAENAGISEASGIENYNNAQRNFAVQHITTVAIPNQETREGLDQFASDPSGRNTALSVIGAVSPNQGSYDYSNVAEDGSRFEHYQGAVGVDTDPNTPTEGSFTLPGSSPSTGEGDTVSGPPPGDTVSGPPPRDTSGPPTNVEVPTVDLSPITNLIGTDAGPGGKGDRTTIMGRQKVMQDFLRSGQQDIENIVTPLGEQVTGLETSIGTAAKGQAPTLMGQTADLATGQAGIQAGIGTAGTGDELGTGLVGGQERLSVGQLALAQGQSGLGRQIGQAGGQLIDTKTGEAATVAPTGLFAGQAGLGEQIGALGTAAVTDPDTGEVTEKPTGLFAGQAGLMAGQTGLGTQISGIGRDLTADIQAETSRLGSQLGRFQSGVEQYQRGATTARGDIQGTQRAGQANLLAQIQGVGQQANRTAEMMAQQRRFNQNLNNRTNQFNQQQQQAAQFARSAPRATPSNQQVGPMGPMASDPRDVLIQNLLRNASLMNRRPV